MRSALIEGRTRVERLLDDIEFDTNGGCWLWSRGAMSNGYGALWDGEKMRTAHRVSWVTFFGAIPAGRFVCHRCDVPLCINPQHLFLGSHAENMADMKAKGRTPDRRGERGGRALITDAQAAELLRLKVVGNTTAADAAARLEIPRRVVHAVWQRITFRNVAQP